MSRLLLDTTFLVDTDRGRASLNGLVQDDDEAAVAAVTIAELLVGALLADEPHRRGRQQFVDDVRATVPVIDYDATVAISHAALLVAVRQLGRPRGAHDLIIAATAHATQREIVSADATAYRDLPGVTVRSHRG